MVADRKRAARVSGSMREVSVLNWTRARPACTHTRLYGRRPVVGDLVMGEVLRWEEAYQLRRTQRRQVKVSLGGGKPC